MSQIIVPLGVSISANLVSKALEDSLVNGEVKSLDELKQKLASLLKVDNANIIADKVVTFLAESGDIQIRGSRVFGSSVLLASSSGTELNFGDNSSVETKAKSAIYAGARAGVIARGGAQIELDEQGNIMFRT